MKTYYRVVDLGRKAMLVRSRIAGKSFLRSAECSSVVEAQRLASELNGTETVHHDVVKEAIFFLEASQPDNALKVLKLAIETEE